MSSFANRWNGKILSLMAVGLIIGCSQGPRESDEAERKAVPTVIPEPTATPPPVRLSLPSWIPDEISEGALSRVRDTLPDREVVLVERDAIEWDVGLDILYPRGVSIPSQPWILERLGLYANRVLLAQTGTPTVGETWEEIAEAASRLKEQKGMEHALALPGDLAGLPGTLVTLMTLTDLILVTGEHPLVSPNARRALDFLRNLHAKGLYKIGPGTGLSGSEAVDLVARGKSAMTLAWSLSADHIMQPTGSNISEQIQVFPPPAFGDGSIPPPERLVRPWWWSVRSEDVPLTIKEQLLKNLSEWRPAGIVGGEWFTTEGPLVLSEVARVLSPLTRTTQENKAVCRLLADGWSQGKSSDVILRGLQARLGALRAVLE